ncbi:MAG: hypothetical protein RBS84_09985, partial [Kiritimatiellia bacterium]|nr:hypothetical protein [Kiritimatiellia bacterium]
LDFEVLTGLVRVDELDRFVMRLPLTDDFAMADLSHDRQEELAGVEKDGSSGSTTGGQVDSLYP